MKYLVSNIKGRFNVFLDQFREYKLPNNIPDYSQGHSKNYVRLGIVPLEKALHLIEAHYSTEFRFSIGNLNVSYSPVAKVHPKLNGYNVNLKSLRIRCFYKKGLICNFCGIKASYFAIERNKSAFSDPSSKHCNPHINAYHLKDTGEEVLMTIDHIIPLSKNGRNTIDNVQVLCYPCNNKKGDKMPDELQYDILKSGVTNDN